MTEIPPSRYKVVERDRRLVVIDTKAEPGPSSKAPSSPAVPRRIAFDGTREWTTRAFYDPKAPRRIRISGSEVRQVQLAVGVVLALVILAVALAGFGAIVVVAVLGSLAAQHGKPWLTRRLDAMAVPDRGAVDR